jgi:multimeric flavodoxin WrbA
MKITILNGNPDERNKTFDDYLARLSTDLVSNGHYITDFELRDMNISYCIGCLKCWVQTPGICGTEDQGREVCRAYFNSDFVLWASPVMMGFYSALLKKVTDKFVCLVHPHGEFIDGEVHHLSRYEHYPTAGMLLEKGPDTDVEDIQIISDIHSRTMLNFKSALAFTKLTIDPVEEVADAINSI